MKECGMKTMGEYILIRQQTVAVYVATRPILDECRLQAERAEERGNTTPMVVGTALGPRHRYNWI